MIANEQAEAIEIFKQSIAAFVKYKTAVSLSIYPNASRVAVVIGCHRADYGKVLGAKQSMLMPLKTIFSAIMQHHGMEGDVFLEDANCVGEREERERFVPNMKWEPDELDLLVRQLLSVVMPNVFQNIVFRNITLTRTQLTIQMEPKINKELAAALIRVFETIGSQQGRGICCEII